MKNRKKTQKTLRNQQDGGDCGGKLESKPAEKPVSLRPLEFEDAVRDLLRAPAKKSARDSKRK